MKNISLSIPNPCSENWDNFAPQSNGRSCGTCEKTVIDFTKMSDQQVLDFLKDKTTNTCGRFRADQLKSYSSIPLVKINPGFTLLKAGLLSLLIIMTSKPTSAQTTDAKVKSEQIDHLNQRTQDTSDTSTYQTIRGIVKNKKGKPLAGVTVSYHNTFISTVTDENGHFELRAEFTPGHVLEFTARGFASKEYVLRKRINRTIITSLTRVEVPLMGKPVIHPTSSIKEIL